MTRKSFLKRYDPVSYWSTRTDPNADTGKNTARVATDLAFIGEHLDGPVFELGPGTGRTFAAYPSGIDVTTRDLSDQHRDHLAALASEGGFSLTQTHTSDPMDRFPAEDQAFGTGLCCQVFLHMPPESFAHAISELSRVSRKLVIIAGFHSTFPEETRKILAAHVFSHDYIAAVTGLGRTIRDVRSEHGLIYLMAT